MASSASFGQAAPLRTHPRGVELDKAKTAHQADIDDAKAPKVGDYVFTLRRCRQPLHAARLTRRDAAEVETLRHDDVETE